MKIKILISIFFLLCFFEVIGQKDAAPLTQDERNEVVDSISSILEKQYVFADIGAQISEFLQKKNKEGAYNSITDPYEFASLLTNDVRAINNDLHLRVGFEPDMIAERKNTITPQDSLDFLERQRRSGQMNNHGFQEVKILDGNIGYLNLTGFYHVDEYSGATAEAAMNFLSNADALIIDLRTNGGGSPSMIQLITSYLFGSESVHLNNFYYRPQDEITQTWTLPYVPGKRRPDVEVFVLTSSRTFSAAEEFSYNLRNLERATLVGEVTGGGAHPGGTRIATERYTIWVPSGRAINPISKTNWEGTGVEPHIKVSANEALDAAKMAALEKLMEKADEGEKFQYEWALAGMKAEKSPHSMSEKMMQKCVGNFGPRSIKFKDGKLFYQRTGNAEYQLVPMTDDLFMIKEIPYFRLQMIKENDVVIGLKGLYNNGRTDKNMRTKNDNSRS